jgi:hypothetical protein
MDMNVIIILLILTVVLRVLDAIFRRTSGDLPVILYLFLLLGAYGWLLSLIMEPLSTSHRLFTVALIAANIPIYYCLFKVFFGSWASFKEMYYEDIGNSFWDELTSWRFRGGYFLFSLLIFISAAAVFVEYVIGSYLLWGDMLWTKII